MRLAVAFALVVVVWGGTAHAADPLDLPSFTAPVPDLLAAARAAPAGDWPVVVLREESERTFDAAGRMVERWRMVFVVRTQAGVDDWGTLSSEWSPFYQDKPAVRIRVIAPDGTTSNLDPSLIHDAPAVEDSPAVFSDRRVLQMPLPRLQIGSVVEEELITTDREPLSKAGTASRFYFGAGVPVQSSRLTISAPADRPLRVVGRALPAGMGPTVARTGGRQTWRYQLGPQAALPRGEADVPGEIATVPQVGLATATSWTAVARDYRQVLERQIAAGPPAWPTGVTRGRDLASVRALVRWLHAHVRYTGIEFGQAAMVPWPPAETLRRGFGDCKDKAVLLVALLRQAGLRADLALLETGPGRDVDHDLPGMGVFDHAIVRTVVAGRPVWIDATEDLVPVGELPARDQSRLSLVIADDTRALVATPSATPASNLVREVRTFELAEDGGARVTELSREGGVFAAEMRAWRRDTRAEDLTRALTSYVEREYAAKALARHDATPPADLDRPFEVTVIATEASRAFSRRASIDVTLFPSDTLDKVPELARTKPATGAPARRHPFVWHRPHVYEIENRLIIPDGFTLPAPPPPRQRALGSASLSERSRVEGRTLIVTVRFDSGKVRLAPAELGALQQALAGIGDESIRISIEHTGMALASRGRPREAVAEMHRLIAAQPKVADHHKRLSNVLLQAGLGQAARRAARVATELAPTDGDAYQVLAYALRHDSFGREFGFDHDRAGALAAYAAALQRSPSHVGALLDRASLLARGTLGDRYGAGSDVAAAITAYRAAGAVSDDDGPELEIAQALLFQAKFDAAVAELEPLESGQRRDGLLVAALAGGRGQAAALELASRRRTGQARDNLLTSAAGSLAGVRHYAPALALFEAANTEPARLALIRRFRRSGTPAVPPADPRAPIVALHRHALGDVAPPRLPGTEVVPLAVNVNDRADTTPDFPLAYLLDVASSLPELTVKPLGPGLWWVDVITNGEAEAHLVARDRGRAVYLAAAAHAAQVGQALFTLLERGDHRGADRVLDATIPHLNAPLRELRPTGTAATPAALALAAALLRPAHPRALAALAGCAKAGAGLRRACVVARSEAMEAAGRWTEMAQLGPDLTAAGFPATMVRMVRARALAQAGKRAEARQELADELRDQPGSTAALTELLMIALHEGVPATIEAAAKALAGAGGADAQQRNAAAWALAAIDRDLPAALAMIDHSNLTEANILNTRGVVLAGRGELGRSIADLHESMRRAGRRTPSDADWYLAGRLAEAHGQRADALAAYGRVKPGTIGPTEPALIDTATMARAQAAALRASARPGP
jgi:transglutaminase-like putative cysteine protease